MEPLESLCSIQQQDLEVQQRIGGASSSVFKGIWKSKEGPVQVAIKQFVVKTPEAVREICKEIKIAETLQGEHLCKLYGACVVNNCEQLWVVTEYVEGDLRSYLDTHSLSLCGQVSFCLQCAEAIASLHNAITPILHRDIKSLSFLVKNNTLLLTDFGISKAKDHVSSSAWAAPETLTKKNQWSQKSDIYSLGMVFYEIATRKIPYNEESSFSSTLKRIKSGKLPHFPADCVLGLSRIFIDCLHRKPTKRPNINELLESLRCLKYKLSKDYFYVLLSDSYFRDLLYIFSRRVSCTESILFIEAVQIWREHPADDKRRSAQEIYDLFLRTNAELQISLSHKTYCLITQKIRIDEGIPNDLFNTAYEDIVRLLYGDIFFHACGAPKLQAFLRGDQSILTPLDKRVISEIREFRNFFRTRAYHQRDNLLILNYINEADLEREVHSALNPISLAKSKLASQ